MFIGLKFSKVFLFLSQINENISENRFQSPRNYSPGLPFHHPITYRLSIVTTWPFSELFLFENGRVKLRLTVYISELIEEISSIRQLSYLLTLRTRDSFCFLEFMSMFFQSSMPRINSILASTARRRGEPRDQTKCEKLSSNLFQSPYFRQNGRYKK